MKHDLGYHVNTHNEKVMCDTCSATYYTTGRGVAATVANVPGVIGSDVLG